MNILKRKFVKWFVLPLLFIGITGAVVAYKMYNKPHRNVMNADAIAVNAAALVTSYEADENKSNGLYLDKVLNVTGEVSDVSKNQKGETVITLKGSDMGGVIATLEGKETNKLEKGSVVKLQGICTGYLTDVVLIRCYLN